MNQFLFRHLQEYSVVLAAKRTSYNPVEISFPSSCAFLGSFVKDIDLKRYMSSALSMKYVSHFVLYMVGRLQITGAHVFIRFEKSLGEFLIC